VWRFHVTVVSALFMGLRVTVSAGDEPITRVGRFLWDSEIDEPPRVLNGFAGEMSFVGPRPTLSHQVERNSSA
jgi:lipopolysaccharide/colanic/teichoic acid biosynthesis glycosyltransferase